MALKGMVRIPNGEFAKLLRDWRKRLGYTQSDMGVLLGVDQTTISAWEVGRQVGKIVFLAVDEETQAELGMEVKA